MRTQTTGHESIEMYLKTVAELGDDHAPVSIAVIAERLGVTATTRASFYLYNTLEEVDQLVEGLHQARKIFRRE